MTDNFPLRGGVTYCEDVPLPLIAKALGTPVYVYSAASMRRQARSLRAALTPLGDPLIAYAVKANPNAAVLATLAAEGLGADVVSGGEYRRARAAGMAEKTPYLRASYDAVVTTARGPEPATTTGLPRSSGRRISSTDT